MNPQLSYEDELQYFQTDDVRTSDIILPPGVGGMLIFLWAVISLVGFAVMFIANKPIAGTIIIAVPTFIGMVIKPSFALCVFMLVLPSGTAVAVEGKFSLNRGIGIALAISFLLNLLLSRSKIRVSRKVLWVVICYYLWVAFSIIVNSPMSAVPAELLTKVQYFAFFLIACWILDTNTQKQFLWGLRSFLLGTVGTLVLAFIRGTAIRSIEVGPGGRLTATVGGTINANLLSAFIALAILAAIYLLTKDRKIILQVAYVATILFLVAMLFYTGSRGTLIAIIGTFVLAGGPKLFLKKPKLAFLMAGFLICFVLVGYYLIHSGAIQEKLAFRLTDVTGAKGSIAGRMHYNKVALKVGFTRVTGAGYLTWFQNTGASHWPHNDLLFVTGIYGLPAGLLFLTLIGSLIYKVKQMPLTIEKLYVKTTLTFLIIIGLKGAYIHTKFFWLFLAVILTLTETSSQEPWQQESMQTDIQPEYT